MKSIGRYSRFCILLCVVVIAAACSKPGVELDLEKVNTYEIGYLGNDNELVESLNDQGVMIVDREIDAAYTGDILIIDNELVSQINEDDVKNYLLDGNDVFFARANNTQQIEEKFMNQKSYEYTDDKDHHVLLQLKHNGEQFVIRSSIYGLDEHKYERLIQTLFLLRELES
ncbi:hypothetical protein [Paenibacillus daejeonensis]|uniref:hypothetical protein n=1 Tax=Paenibacillus daejeonensis TaxID=135193 RepID=UPI000371C6D2|nr:hypothetical protein [Paenibacillus daejeonensis]